MTTVHMSLLITVQLDCFLLVVAVVLVVVVIVVLVAHRRDMQHGHK